MSQEPSNPPSAVRKSSKKLILLAVVVAAAATAYFLLRDSLTLQNFADQEGALKEYQTENPAAVYGIAFAVYVVITGLSLPGAAVLSLVYGWFFGFWPALLLVSFASTSGATIAFLISRYLLRDTIQARFGKRLVVFNQALEREGAFYLFTLRLLVAVPFFVINLVMGLTPIGVGTFWWVSQVGMLAGTAVYVYAGASVPDLQPLADDGLKSILSMELIAAFVVLGLLPLVLKQAVARVRSKRGLADEKPTSDDAARSRPADSAPTT